MSYSYNFNYNKQFYPSGTKFIYKGIGIDNFGHSILLNNEEIIWKYYKNRNCYFLYNNKMYQCPFQKFKDGIIGLAHETTVNITPQKEEFYWTDEDVSKTIWYICIMLFAIIFHDRIFIWILATFIWYRSVFKK